LPVVALLAMVMGLKKCGKIRIFYFSETLRDENHKCLNFEIEALLINDSFKSI
jgi:hypothetical protein